MPWPLQKWWCSSLPSQTLIASYRPIKVVTRLWSKIWLLDYYVSIIYCRIIYSNKYFPFSCWRPYLAPTWPPSMRACWVDPAVLRARPYVSALPACIQASTTTASWRHTRTSLRHLPMQVSVTWCRLNRSRTPLGELGQHWLYRGADALDGLVWNNLIDTSFNRNITWHAIIMFSQMVRCHAEGLLPTEVKHR